MLTITTCWYILNSKFNKSRYDTWIKNFILHVRNFYLVIFTNEESKHMILPYVKNNQKIKIIIKEFEHFYNYKYKDYWIKNHKINNLLNSNSKHNTEWKLNMLWCEKIAFVKEVINNKYFVTPWYGWCDIGYFRDDTDKILLNNYWPNKETIKNLINSKIYYAKINNKKNEINSLIHCIMNKNEVGLPTHPINPTQTSIAGGFFLITQENINWWFTTFDTKLELYFKNNYLVKDDQMIIINCIVENITKFFLVEENNISFDKWFMFKRFLL